MTLISCSLNPSSHSAAQLFGVTGVIFLCYLLSLGIHRLYLSPLAKVPGPKLAALASWYEFYHEHVKHGRYEWKIRDMHKKYGPLVRISPREIHINDPDFYETLFAQKLDKDPVVVGQFGHALSTQATSASDLHRVRRAAIAPFFSQAKVTELQSMITDKIEVLCRKLRECHRMRQPANMYDLYRGLAVDVITEFAFHRSWDFLDRADSGQEWFRMIMTGAKAAALLRQFPWLLCIMTSLPMWLTKILVPDVEGNLFIEKIVTKEVNAIFEAGPDGLKHGKEHRNIFYELIYNSKLPSFEKSRVRLIFEGQLIVIAGTETTGYVLTTLHFHLLANPDKLAKLKGELVGEIKSLSDIPDWQRLRQLPYLSACIDEALRLPGGITHRLARMAPKGGLQWQDQIIPEGVQTPNHILSHTANNYLTDGRQHDRPRHDMSPNIFPQPHTFSPERWLAPEAKSLKRYIGAFSKGPRACAGIELAYAELFLTVAMVFRRFDMELFETTFEDIEVAHDFFIASMKSDSKGLRIMIK
ncbi:hypothetical protein MMC18_000955 [Xylographa bjoerkii]|nr:hypothetical protein [Xylographa bjoerkii]